MLMMFMETTVKERSMTSKRMTESAFRDSTLMKMKENEGSTSRDTRVERHEKRTESDDSKRNKFKKVEMPIFNGEDLDSWLFRANKYFQIHKLTEFEKMIVATISFKEPMLNWY
ncbi:transposon Tf2-1 polyprotein isoform X1 [Cucumis melo var. makuwa]|uniref:Transposon Tf2-1 polyprotein isoform X1 n=1 Tax=Cucumis melo var. makuwa TaxID=1194695 RepID=A0A5A7V859_CUCMM|nr:transposon Tf2-1 polyprotein isoform X1 [Cucumis melo var. makuwa]TYK20273.1 transposon Tf2-1 polyprotein isoform X1 [Cucumis melo var. makuwa]